MLLLSVTFQILQKGTKKAGKVRKSKKYPVLPMPLGRGQYDLCPHWARVVTLLIKRAMRAPIF
jgi:hypothetical protein